MSTNEIVDAAVLIQLLELDEDDIHREFSRGLLSNYFSQAQQTIASIRASMETHDLETVSRLGHFLKGSSAAIGLRMIRSTCERIQLLGSLKTGDGDSIDKVQAMASIVVLLGQVDQELNQAKEYLQQLYQTTFS
ncbi:hypothetical protein BASA50_007871 [Batrachochytrium salamandrivorans]|uniref:HPt domain-containing protein n=1 Tax=Batrachochytrium salamandrivorans TaxID=1357716 RepID=A0ABQ8F978_9FUNG|nr:hypothetical protein BASA62_004031 [Batrachochytrium salamandrivorans]KAH6578757.1 hypothetical protein BASA60_003530 [Batrachochytrium salamandrivorans]KAH6582213.1 hypothetical protein BASA61_008617 [Batrachochytrium salamandrivorans]KAH6592820.1 hypothetical protein BASA50_007871 [Batrachochytrium salamandrivorans]KAH9250728.1 hypothetical protein BASA81_011444 [Batrachochytrium salamandrivorans]